MTQPPFKTLIADPPWAFQDHLPGKSRGAAKNYEMMTLKEIENFPLPLLAKDARIFLWRVSSMQDEAIKIMGAWGFSLKSEIVWLKMTKTGKRWFGMGRQVRNCHETCLIGVRGKPPTLDKSIRSTFEGRVGIHSEKPPNFYRLVERLSPGPYCEMFARKGRKGWTSYGLDLEQSRPKGEYNV